MELGTTLTIEVALAIGVTTVIIFQLSNGSQDRGRQQLPAGVIIGLYILFFQLMAIFALPYLIRAFFDPELTIVEKIFSPNKVIDISSVVADKFIKDRLIDAVSFFIILLLSSFEEFNRSLQKTDIKTPLKTALIIVFYINMIYGMTSRYVYTIQSEFWLHAIYITINVVAGVWANLYMKKQISQASKNNDDDIDPH